LVFGLKKCTFAKQLGVVSSSQTTHNVYSLLLIFKRIQFIILYQTAFTAPDNYHFIRLIDVI